MQIGPDLAVAMIIPLAAKCDQIPPGQCCVGDEQIDDRHQLGIQILAVPCRFLSLIVALKSFGEFNLAHSDFAAACLARPL